MIFQPLVCIRWIIVGMMAGLLARRLMRSAKGPLIVDLILGLAGEYIGRYITGIVMGFFGFGVLGGGIEDVIISLVTATAGAMILIFIGRLIRRR